MSEFNKREQELATGAEVLKTRPAAGEFRVAYAPELDAPRIVYVVKHRDNFPFCEIMLVEDLVEIRTDTDVLFNEEETGLHTPVIIQTHMCSSVLDEQLSEPFGRLEKIPDYLRYLLPEPDKLPAERVGLALRGSSDARYAWKIEEAKTLMNLARPIIAGFI